MRDTFVPGSLRRIITGWSLEIPVGRLCPQGRGLSPLPLFECLFAPFRALLKALAHAWAIVVNFTAFGRFVQRGARAIGPTSHAVSARWIKREILLRNSR